MALTKLKRNYILQVQRNQPFSNEPSGSFLTIKPPFTIEFDINRNTLSSANNCTLRIYNLGLLNRNAILKDQFDSIINRQVVLHAGYGDGPNFPLIFLGTITRAWSVREGNNFITQIDAFDGGNAFVNAKTSLNFPSGTPYQNIIVALVKELAQFGIKPGHIGSFSGSVSRGYAPEASITETLVNLTGGGFYIDNGFANCLSTSEVFADDQIQVISAQTGLLNTPVREETLLNIETIFEPNLRVGQAVKLQSVTGANYNAQYRVVGIHHKGMISNAVCGNLVTNVSVLYTPTPRQVTLSASINQGVIA